MPMQPDRDKRSGARLDPRPEHGLAPMNRNVTLFSFSFGHHGRFSSFHRLLDYSRPFRTIDITLPLLWRTGEWLQPRLETRWRRLNEWRLRPVFARSERQCVHYLYPENTVFHGADWKGKHGLVLSCHQPGSRLQEARKAPFHAGFFRGLEKADRVVLLASNFLREYAEFCDPERLVVIHHGVDTDYFRPAEKPPARPLVLTVGNWLRDYDLWADSALQLAGEFSELEFAVVALPDTVRQARAKVDGKLGGRVRFLSGLTDAQLLRLYQRTTLLFLPLKDAGANNAILEAMACGVPIAVTDLPATREYAGDSAMYFGPSSVTDCVRRVGPILQDALRASALSRAGRLRAEQEFAWPQIARRYAGLYQQVLQLT